MKYKAVVLAAGKGTRMRADGSDLPKVMRKVLGRPLIDYVLKALPIEDPGDVIVVVGYKKELVMEAYPRCVYVEQREQLGTGHAVMSAAPELEGFEGGVLVCAGDMPLISRETLTALLAEHERSGNDCTILSGVVDGPVPEGYGHVIRAASGRFVRIVEARDCAPEEKETRELNSSIYAFDCPKLLTALTGLRRDNNQGEYYLTDVPRIELERGDKVGVCVRPMGAELMGVNTPEQLRAVEQAAARLGLS